MEPSKVRAPENLTQNILFNSSDKEYTYEILAQEVAVQCSPGLHNHGSSKVKLTNVVDYNWELRFYVGQLLAVHLNGRVIAYGIKGKSDGMVRVANLETNQRALIKEMNGSVQDISFALIPQQIILACIDTDGNLFVYNIEDQPDTLECSLLMHIVHSKTQATNYRVIWCPYLPSYGEDSDTLDDPAKILALLNGNKVEVWDVSIVHSKYGSEPLQPHDDYEGYVEISSHSRDVVDASFSPDGTAIATASLDGFVKFFQVYMVENEKPRCLHEWNPHDGASLSSLLFLDNMHAYGPDSRFWKFAITGCNCNSVLKIWSCETWTCLQTINFRPNPNSLSLQLFFKVRLDMTGQYLLMSDINNRILYVLQIEKNDSERIATVSSISEFLLPAPILSYHITNADIRKFNYTGSSEDLSLEVNDDDDSNIAAVVIKMYVVQPKRLQECTITFQPESLLSLNCENVFSADSSDQTLVNLIDKTDDEQETEAELPELNDLQLSVNYLIQQQTAATQPTLTLMTPDAFNSPPNNHTSPMRNSISPLKLPNEEEEEVKVETLIDTQTNHKDNYTSAHSSPSREVEEILSFKTQDEQLMDIFKKIDGENGTKYNSMFNENSANHETAWPNIPIPKANEIAKEENRKLNSANDTAQINARINMLETVIREQNNHIQKLHAEIKASSSKPLSKDDIKNIFSTELEKALSKNQAQQSKTLENFASARNDLEEKIVSNMMPILAKQITEKLQFSVSHEIKTVVLPSVINVFESLKHQLSLEYNKEMNRLLKENVTKLITSKLVADSLSTSIVNIIKPNLEECNKEMVRTTLVPSLERVCGTMFQQIHDTFTKGTKEYIASVENYMDRQRRVQDKGKDLLVQMQAVSDTIKSNADQLSKGISQDIEQRMGVLFSVMQEQLSRLITNLVTDTLKQGFKNHATIFEDSVINAVRSRAVTPAPHILDTQVQLAHIMHLVSKGQIDAAFQQALSASDLSLVMHLCEKINPQDIFTVDHCKLPQPVLLSLIQQLSADLGRNTELKHKYLIEAVLKLEPTNAVTREHMPIVLSDLLMQLSNFLSSHPSNKNAKNLQILCKVVKSFLRD